MAAERFEIRIPAFKLLIAMMVIIIPICFIGLLAITRADTTLEQTAGTDFKTLAQIKASQVANFIHERVAEVRNLSIGLAVANAVAAGNQKYQGRSDAEILAAAANTTKIWNTPAADPLVTEILSTPASRLLRKHQQYDPSFLRITVTDIRGAVVAATHKPVVYSQADDEHWRNIYADGRGAVNVTDVLYDDVTKSNYVGIGMPILEEGSSRLIGTIDVLMEVSAIFPLLRDVQLGRTGRLMLVQDDGTVVAAPGVSTAAKMKAEEYAAIRDALGTVSGRQTGYIVASFRDSRQLIGFADTGLKDDYPKLGWVVLAAQDTREALASVRTVDRVLALMSVLGLLGVVLFCVYVFLHSQQSYEDLAGVVAPPSPPSPAT
jgi:hypothetical protein